ncbi:uncharacterized protein LOC142351720 [Convolutriloba macropyga]|uniref:uncharacterized protein LOC142351720 n=1 Tax=Convolutriloba macropyga TaxID=536237 RepID=UPI003F51EA80
METHSCPDEHFQTPDSKPPSTVDYSESLSGDLGTALESANFADESEVCECDLGLGRTKISEDEAEAEERAEMHSDQYLLYSAKLPSNLTKYGSFRKMLKLKKRNSCIESTNSSTEILDEDPAIAMMSATVGGQNSTAIGSSLQQQKTICRKDVENVFIQKLLDEIQHDDSCFQSKGGFLG